jgi:glutamine amidotransferase
VDKELAELILNKKTPILGICLGMQLFGNSNTESGFIEVLGFINGKVESFTDKSTKILHVGYNQVRPNLNSRLYISIKSNPDYYFTHSYRMTSECDIDQATCSYSEEFVARFEKDNIAGARFHPELIHKNGLKLLKQCIENF